MMSRDEAVQTTRTMPETSRAEAVQRPHATPEMSRDNGALQTAEDPQVDDYTIRARLQDIPGPCTKTYCYWRAALYQGQRRGEGERDERDETMHNVNEMR